MLGSCCTNPKKTKKLPRLVLVPARTAVILLNLDVTWENQIQRSGTTFETSATMSRSLECTKTAVALQEHPRVHRRVVHFRINGVAGVIA